MIPAVLAFGYCVTAILAWPSSHTLHAKLVVAFVFAWLRASYVACLARKSGRKLLDTDLTEWYITSLLLFFLVVFTVAVPSAFMWAIVRGAMRAFEAARNVAWLFAFIFAAMVLDLWAPILQPRSFLRHSTPAPTPAEKSALPQQPGVRFELGTLMLLITFICINLGLAAVSSIALIVVDFLLFIGVCTVGSFASNVLMTENCA